MSNLASEPEEAQLLWPASDPHADEGLLGWVAQTASEQFMSSTFQLLRVAGQTHPQKRYERLNGGLDAEKLAQAMMIEPGEIRVRLYQPAGDDRVRFFGATIPAWHVDSSRRRYSPASLDKDPWHRGSWEHRFIPFCTKSFEYLTNKCPRPDCRTVQGWYRAGGVTNCDECGQPLTASTRRKVPEPWRETLRFVAGLVSSDPDEAAKAAKRLPQAMADDDRGEIFDLVLRLLPVLGENQLTHSTGIWWARHPVRLANALQKAGAIVLGWPESINAELVNLAGRRTHAPQDGVHKALGALLRRDGVRAGSLSDRLLEGLAESMRAQACGRLAGTETAYSIKTTAVALGEGTAEIASARRAGLLVTVPMLRGGEVVPGLSKAQVDWLVDMLKHRDSAWSVAHRWGIPIYAVEHLVELGELPHVDESYLATRHPWPFLDERDVTRLEHQLEIKAASLNAAFSRSLLDCMKAIGGRLKPWSAAMAAFRAGEIPFALSAEAIPLAKRLMIRPEDSALISGLRSPAIISAQRASTRLLSRVDAADVLNLNCKSTRDLAAYETKGSSTAIGIPAETVIALGAAHITGAEIAARWRISPARVGHLLRDAGVARSSFLGWPRDPATKALDRLVACEFGAPKVGEEKSG